MTMTLPPPLDLSGLSEPRVQPGDARKLARLMPANSVDVIVTSPPYWRKRDYGHADQFGQEASADAYVGALLEIMRGWRAVLKPTGSVFINVADSYRHRRLAGIPALLEVRAAEEGWRLAHRIIWTKEHGMPEAHARLAQRHEFILHFAWRRNYYVDLFDYAHRYGDGAKPGDVWTVSSKPERSAHLAPFPEELARRMIVLGCPERVCAACGQPIERIIERGTELNPNRPQARRALELYREKGLTPEHLAAIRATGISDAGKGQRFQRGALLNSERTRLLAEQAKEVLGGYFREFTFARPEQRGWAPCRCGAAQVQPGVVVDPFAGTGTTLRAAHALGRHSFGFDLQPPHYL